jgi:hypothetical protein
MGKAKGYEGLTIHLLGGDISCMGLSSISYRRAACGSRAERWLTTANTELEVENVNCPNCKRTKAYKKLRGA